MKRRSLLRAALAAPAAAMLACLPVSLLALPAAAEAVGAGGTAAAAPAWLQNPRAPVAAHYRISVQPSGETQDWYFYRRDTALHLIKPAVEEVWSRDRGGQVSFERLFLKERRSVYYSAGELRTLNIDAQWDALTSLIDARDMAALTPLGEPVAGQPWRLSGSALAELVWNAELQLPERLVRRVPGGQVEWQLVATHKGTAAMPGWPQPGGGPGESFDRLDAADLGDMEYDVFARKAARYDLRAGWRAAHEH